MYKSIKSILWSVLLLSIYIALQRLCNIELGLKIVNLHPSYPEAKTWWMGLFLKQAGTHMRMLLPVFISMIVYYVLYKFVLKEKITLSYGFAKANAKSVFIGIGLAVLIVLLYSLVLYNHLWEELLHKEGIIDVLEILSSPYVFKITRITACANIIMILPMVTVIPFFKEILFRGLIYNKLAQALKLPIAICLQAVLFGAVSGNLQDFLKAFLIGLTLGAVYMTSKSIWLPIMINVILNVSVPIIQEVDNFPSKLLSSFKTDGTKVLDTFVYNSVNGSKPLENVTHMPLAISLIIGLVLALAIAGMLVWLWRCNKVVEND